MIREKGVVWLYLAGSYVTDIRGTLEQTLQHLSSWLATRSREQLPT